MTLIAGVATPDSPHSRSEWKAVHEGRTSDPIPKDFVGFNKDAFTNQFLMTFLDFVKRVDGE